MRGNGKTARCEYQVSDFYTSPNKLKNMLPSPNTDVLEKENKEHTNIQDPVV